MKRLLLFYLLGILLAGCGNPPTRVVTMVVPYVAVLPLDVQRDPGLDGRVICDMIGVPVILLRPTLPPEQIPFVMLHEKIHVAQAQAHPRGCIGLRTQMAQDTMYRLQMEAEAFCGVVEAQRRMQVKPEPSVREIVDILATRYYAAYDSTAITAAMRCR